MDTRGRTHKTETETLKEKKRERKRLVLREKD